MIAVPIIASSVEEAKKQARKAGLIELRLDYIQNLNEKKLEQLIAIPNKKIITIRRKDEGGKYKLDEKKRIELLRKAVDLGVEYVDVEARTNENVIKSLIKGKSKIIVSWHNFKRTDKKQIQETYKKIKRLNPDIIKIVAFANTINDNLIIFDLIKKAVKDKKKIIGLCMGEKGEISRILSPALGALLTFGSLEEGKESASGQITVDKLKNVYKVDKLNSKTKIFGLVGNPVSKSKGYLIHNNMFDKRRINAVYVNFLVDDVGGFVNGFKSIINGLSITMPHKKTIMKQLDKVSSTAKQIDAVNTVVKKGNQLIGYNTDSVGAVKAIEKRIKIKNKDFVIIGAGGAAKAIAFGIKKKGGSLIILNRTLEKARLLAKQLHCAYDGLNITHLNVDCLINTTSVGMAPKTSKSPIDKKLLKGMVVMDVIYNPKYTKLLKDAQANRCKVISGEEMFVNQAMEQFNIWLK